MTATIQDPWAQPTPAGAYDDLLVRALPLTRAQRRWEPSDGPLPALFVSHGAPPTLDEPQWLQDLFAWAQSMPKPRAIVIVSAHWEDAPVAISSAAAGTPLVYDFGGFAPKYYRMTYETPDASALAARVAQNASAASAAGAVPTATADALAATVSDASPAVTLQTAAPHGLRDRDVRVAFQSGRTGASPLRQGLAALLAGELGLDVERTSPGAAGAGFALTPESEETLTAWMREHLTLRAWVAQDASALEGVAREVAADLAPALQPGALEAPVAQRVAAMRASARRSATL